MHSPENIPRDPDSYCVQTQDLCQNDMPVSSINPCSDRSVNRAATSKEVYTVFGNLYVCPDALDMTG